MFGKSRDRFCAPQLKGILVVANSHSNKDEQPDAPSNFLLERLLAATMAMRRWQCPLQRTAVIQGVIFPNILWRA